MRSMVLYTTMQQMDLPFYHEDHLREYFEKRIRKNVILAITDNSTSMLSIRTKGDAVSVRLHRMFLSAADTVLDELAEFIKNKKGGTPQISAFINKNIHFIKQKSPQPTVVCTQGRYYDLMEMYHALNMEYFDNRISAGITWGKKVTKHRVYKRTLGSYNHHNNMIRINRLLDSNKIPFYYISYVVYHEMLHADIGTESCNGRRSVHPKKFRERERQFRHYLKAMEWERKGGNQ